MQVLHAQCTIHAILNADFVQVGFAVAFCAELALPTSGLFGAWNSEKYSAYLGAAAVLITSAAVRF